MLLDSKKVRKELHLASRQGSLLQLLPVRQPEGLRERLCLILNLKKTMLTSS